MGALLPLQQFLVFRLQGIKLEPHEFARRNARMVYVAQQLQSVLMLDLYFDHVPFSEHSPYLHISTYPFFFYQ